MKNIALAILVLTSGCTSLLTEPQRIVNSSTTYELSVKKKNPQIRHGKYTEYYHDQLVTQGRYRNGVKEGKWRYHYFDKDAYIEGNYKEGKRHGEWKFYVEKKEVFYTLYINDKIPGKNGKLYDYPGQEGEVFTVVQEMPEFPHGDVMQYIRKNVSYPASAKDKGISGTLYFEFIIDPLGDIVNIKTIRSVPDGEELEKEAFRVFQEMPRWYPGFNAGKPVPVRFTIPIKFMLK